MDKVISIIFMFLFIYFLVYIFYFIFMINKYDKDGKRKKKKKKEKKKREYKFLKAIKNIFYNEKDEILFRGREPKKKKKDKNEEEKIPTEVELLLYRYNLDVSKMNYKDLLKMVGRTCAFDIALILTIVFSIPTKNIYIELIVGAVLIIPVILISYSILGNYLKKKGMTKDEVRKRTKNRK